ncbi:hypothetical protein QIW31_06150 [Francisellaceae bacterium CB299]|jgi:hypothetical protein
MCYTYGNDAVLRDNPNWFQLYTGPDYLSTGDNSTASNFASDPFRYFVPDGSGGSTEIEINSQTDIDNLTPEQADKVNIAMSMLKDREYCSNSNNTDKFACSL